MGNSQHTNMSKSKLEIMALSLAAIDKLGKDSPASLIATDTFVLKDISEILKCQVSKIFVCGGDEQTAEILDIEKGEWKSVAPMSMSRYHHCSFFYKNKIFVLGGYTTNQKTEVFDVEKGS